MKADIQPRWLVSLMCQWARRHLPGYVQGYPSKVAFLSIPSGNDSRTDPTGDSAQDFDSLELALKDCADRNPERFAAMMMYYRPWVIEAMQADGWPFANSTYYSRLHLAHKQISTFICEIKLKAA